MRVQEVVFDRFGGTVNDQPSLAVQSAKDECDINRIMRNFGVTGLVPQVVRPPLPADYNLNMDFRQLMDIVNSAERSFMSLNADVRARFNNDPARFVDFCGNPENLPELRKLGLALPEKVPTPEPVMKVEVVTPNPK